jgi:hypothetical protein
VATYGQRKFQRGARVKHTSASTRTVYGAGQVMMARHASDQYLVRWTATFQNGETKTWIGEHSRMVLKII